MKIKYNKRLISLISAGAITVTLSGCAKDDQSKTVVPAETTKPIVYVENNKEKINLENVIALTRENETLFVKYDNLSDKYFTDVFTGAKYFVKYNMFLGITTGSVKGSINNKNCYVYNRKHNIANISDYIFNATQDISEYNSYELLKQVFLNANNINDEEISSSDKNMIYLKNLVALTNDNETLFVKYDYLDDTHFTDVFTGARYYIGNVEDSLYSGECYVDKKYQIKSVSLYPYVVSQSKNGFISKEILNESFKKSRTTNEKTLTKK